MTSLVSTVGFPIVCCGVMAWFIFQVFKKTTDESQRNMERVQERCREREERLYEEISKNREVNAKALETIKLYAERLTHIETSVEHIQNDVLIIKDRVKQEVLI